MLTPTKITELFCHVDDFVHQLEKSIRSRLLSGKCAHRERRGKLSYSEMMTIVIAFHQSGYRTFKQFYRQEVCLKWRGLFPDLVSYPRFITWMPRILLPLCVYLKSRFGQATGIAFIDATALAVCHPKRITRNRVFNGIAKLGKSTYGWFFGFKLHLVINDRGDLLGLKLTPGNVDDRVPVDDITALLTGSLFADKGYISSPLAASLRQRRLRLITPLRKNMKPKILSLWDKLMLRKRSIIETVNDQLKNISQICHSRHRSPNNFLVNLIAGLIAYTWQPRKPSIRGLVSPLNAVDLLQLAGA